MGTFINIHKWEILFISSLMILSGYLASIMIVREFWYDEAFTNILISKDWYQGNIMILHDVHPPLYYWLLKIFSVFTGSEMSSLRVFSTISHLLTIPVLYLILKKQSKLLKLTVLLIFSISPFFIFYATEARMYSLFALLTLISVYFFKNAITQKNLQYNKSYKYAAIFLALTSFTHYFGVFLALAYLIVILTKFKPFILNKDVEYMLRNLFLPISFFYIFLIGLITYQGLQASSGIAWIKSATLDTFPETLISIFYGSNVGNSHQMNDSFFFNGGWGVAILTWVVGYYIINYKKILIDRASKPLVLITLIPYIVVFSISYFTVLELYVDRYFLPFAVLAIILIFKFIYRPFGKFAILLFLLLMIFYGGAVNNYYDKYEGDLTWQNENFFLDVKKAHGSENLVFESAQDYTNARALLGDEVRFFPYFSQDEDFSGWQAIKQSNYLTESKELKKGDIVIFKFVSNDQLDNIKSSKIFKEAFTISGNRIISKVK